jgi:hypothetical protein
VRCAAGSSPECPKMAPPMDTREVRVFNGIMEPRLLSATRNHLRVRGPKIPRVAIGLRPGASPCWSTRLAARVAGPFLADAQTGAPCRQDAPVRNPSNPSRTKRGCPWAKPQPARAGYRQKLDERLTPHIERAAAFVHEEDLGEGVVAEVVAATDIISQLQRRWSGRTSHVGEPARSDFTSTPRILHNT